MFEFKIKKELKNKKIKRTGQEVEPQEILLDALSQRKELISQRRFEVPLQNKMLAQFCFLFLLLILFLIVKTFQLQILQGKEFLELAKQNYQRIYYKRVSRGVIYDKDFNQLVFNEPSFDLICDKHEIPSDFQGKEIIFNEISEITGQENSFIKEKIEKSQRFQVLIAENLDRETLILLQSKIQAWPGFYIDENVKRSYPNGSTFAHLIGYLGRITEQELEKSQEYSVIDYIGKSGLEKSYEYILKGNKQKTLVEKNALGTEVNRQKISDSEPGKSLVLWLDSGLQNKLTNALKDSLKRVGAKSGAAVVMNVKTGGILALVSLPSFDNNIFFEKLYASEWQKILDHPQKPFWNRVVSATYPTGSTIKPLIAVAALEEKIVLPEKNIFCEGEIAVENPWFPEEPWIFHDWAVHGYTDIRKAIAESCNVYFYTIGGGYGNIEGLGEARIKKYLELFGWGQISNIDIPGERPGLIPDKQWKKQYFEDSSDQIWMPGDTYNLSIGQGYVSITPIQVVAGFVAIANNGKLLKPMLVKQIIDEQKNVIQNFDPEIIKQDFVDQKNLEIIQQGMRGAVTYGSSVILNDLPVKLASKTGTAQTGRKNYYHNWVTVFGPYEDPEIVLTVMIENVPQEQVAALPVAKEVLYWYFTQKELNKP